MATTVTYKGSTLTSATNQTKVLKTAGKYMEDDVTITDSTTAINNQNKNVTPTESVQSVTADTGYTGLGTVTVAGISSTYVGTGVTRRSSSNMTASGAIVTAPAGYYSQNASKTISNATLSSPSITYDDELLYVVTRVSTAGYVTSGAISTSVINITTVNSLPTKAAATYIPTTANQTIAAQQWLTGAQTIQGDANLIANNIASGVSIFNVNGTYQGKLPVFNLVWAPGEAGLWEDLVDDPDTIVSITCNKTFQECLALQNGFTHDAVVDAIEEDYPNQHYFSTVQCEGGTASALKYLVYTNGKAEGTILYQSNGTITASYGGDTNLTLNVTASGTYYPTNGVYTQVNVPAATTASASVYVDDHDTLVGSVVVTSAGWIPTQTIETVVDPVDLEPNLTASNIKSGVSIFGIAGTCTPGGGSYTVGISFEDKDDPNEYYEEKYYTVSDDSFFTFKQEYLSVTPSSQAQTFNATNPFSTGSHAGYYEVYVAGDADLVSNNIRSGISIFGVSGNTNVVNTSDATASSGDIRTSKTAYVGGNKLTGTLGLASTPLTSYISTVSGTKTIGAGILDSSYTVSISATEQAKIISDNIKSGITILGVSGSSTVVNTAIPAQALPAAASQILGNRKAYVNGVALTGTMSFAGNGDLFEISTKTGTIALDGYYQDSAVQIDTAEQAKIIAGNIRSGVTLLGISGDSNVVNTSAGTASSADILSGKIAFVDGAQKTGTMTSNAATTTSITTKTQSVTIPAGYHTGSGKVQISTTEQNKIIAGNIKSGVSILGITGTYTGSGGLEYETGTYEPYNDESRPTISFSKSHTTIPRVICMQKASGAGQSSSNYGWMLYNFDAVNTAGVSYNGSTAYHGQVQWTFRSGSGTAISSGGRAITYGQASTGANTSTYIRYWATESNFKPYSASTARYWRSTDTFTWYAIW